MNLDVKNIKIKNFLGEWNIDWDLKKVNVLVGKNGSGKTKLLELIQNIIERDREENINILCNEAKISFSNGIELNTYILEDKNSEINIQMKNLMLSNFDQIKKEISEEIKKNNDKKLSEVSNAFIEMLEKNLKEGRNIATGKDSLILNKNLTRAYNTKLPASINQNFKIKDNLSITFLSTVNMTANAISTVNKSNGKISTVLDMEISDEIQIILNSENKSNTLKFEKIINKFFIDTNKKITLDKNGLIIFKEDESEPLKLNDLSSGERQLIFIFLKIINSSDKKTLILMDEPEISLHLRWQENLIKSILEVNHENQIIIVTHSPAMIMHGWLDSYTDIEKIRTEV